MEAVPRTRNLKLSPQAPRSLELFQRPFSSIDNDSVDSSQSNSADRKSSRRVNTGAWMLLPAIGGTLLFTILLSLKVHFKQPTNAETFDLRLKTSHGRDDQQLSFLRGEPIGKTAVKPDASAYCFSTTAGPKTEDEDRSLTGLLANFSEYGSGDACASRGQRPIAYTPSAYLRQRLRAYESLHRKCASHAKDFISEVLEKGSKADAEYGECRFVVWLPHSGLGNRLLTLVSTFLYALLTNRILLVDSSTDVKELFCEPFSGTSWLLPSEFPQAWLEGLNETSRERFGNLFNKSAAPPAFGYVHLTHTYNLDDRKFFCDQGQDYLRQIPCLFMRANLYIVPGLYFLSSFAPQLHMLFPHEQKEAIFHLLGGYLFHPSDRVWGWIRRFRKAYLATEEQVGIQIRTFNDTPQAYFLEQLSRCALDNKVLPDLELDEMSSSIFDFGSAHSAGQNEVLSVLVTSLQPEYYESIRDHYMSAPAKGGQFVAVHQPSHEGWQKTDTLHPNLKAWAEISLLSVSDVLITSGWSTFGYVAQALAGVKPWILFRSFERTVPDPPCMYAKSIEPCFHTPPLMDCDNIGVPQDPSKILPFIQSCEDIPWGIKIIEPATA